MATHKITSTRCYLNLPLGAREEETAVPADGEAASSVGQIEGKVQGDQNQTESQSGPVMVNGNADSKESSVAEKVFSKFINIVGTFFKINKYFIVYHL